MSRYSMLILLFVALPFVLAIENDPGYEPLFASCSGAIEKIDTVDQMRKIVDLMIKYHSDHGQSYPRSMKRCMAEYDSIKDLNNIIKVDKINDVCHPHNIRTILDYRNQHLAEPKELYLGKKKRMVRKFVKRYALQVSLICRQNLVDNLVEANNQFTPEDFDRVFPWRKLIHTDNKSLNETQLVESRQALESADQLFKSITQVDQVIALVRSFSSKRSGDDSIANQAIQEVGEEKITVLRDTCRRMSSFYEGAIMSIASLASIGYDWNGYKLNHATRANEEQRQLVSDWLSASIVCGSILTYAPLANEPVQYHEFGRDQLVTSKTFESKQFVKKYSVSKAQIFVNKWSIKFAQSMRKLAATSKSDKNGRANKLLGKMSRAILDATGDSPSKAEFSEGTKVAFVFVGIFVAIFVALMFSHQIHLAF